MKASLCPFTLGSVDLQQVLCDGFCCLASGRAAEESDSFPGEDFQDGPLRPVEVTKAEGGVVVTGCSDCHQSQASHESPFPLPDPPL